MRIVLSLLILLCCHAGIAAEPAGGAALQAAIDACHARAAPERDACLEKLLAPTPDEAARVLAGQQWTAAYSSRVARELAASGAARELAFAASLHRASRPYTVTDRGIEPGRPLPDPLADAWWRQAAARAGNDVLAWTLLVQDEPRMREQAAARWQALEPDNLAAWLAGEPTVDRLLSAVVHATHYTSHLYQRLRWMAATLRAHPPSAAEARAWLAIPDGAPAAFDPEQFATIAAFGIDMAVATPALLPLMQACRAQGSAMTPTRRQQCRHVAGLMADRSDTQLAESIGIGLLKTLAGSDLERDEAARRRRHLEWQQFQRFILDGGGQGQEQRFLKLFRDPSLRNERELTERMLREAGVPLEPHAGWTMPPPQSWFPPPPPPR